MGWSRRTRDDREPDTVRMPRTDDRFPPAQGDAGGYRQEGRERTDSYWTFFVLGLAAPFLLAIPLYPLAWYPVWYVILPVAVRVTWSGTSGPREVLLAGVLLP